MEGRIRPRAVVGHRILYLSGRAQPARGRRQRGALISRIVQEALANIEHHVHATRVDVSLAIGEHDGAVTIVDDGTGLHPGDADQTARFVLNGMREPIDVFGGELQVQSIRRGGGRTYLSFRIPLAGKDDLETAPA